jgi:hypothetical protein
MIQINDTNNELRLKDIITFFNVNSEKTEWLVSNLEYSGETYNGMFPVDIEEKSKEGIGFNADEFLGFEKTINQIIEAEIVCKNESDLLIKIIFLDGSLWEIDGDMSLDFIKSFNLEILKN